MTTFRYTGDYAKEISMPAGGIGAGCVGLAGNGELTDWEITGAPGKGVINPFTHIAVKAETKSATFARVLQGDRTRDLTGKYSGCTYGHSGYGYGPDSGTMAGFPHFAECTFEGAFPWARLDFSDPAFPGKPSLTALSPFIPGDEDASSAPRALFTVEIENDTDAEITYTAAFTLGGFLEGALNAETCIGGFTGLNITSGANGLCVMTDAPDAAVQTNWFRGSWFDGPTVYWNQFAKPGFMPDRKCAEPGRDPGTLQARLTLAPGETGRVRFVLAWYFPIWLNDWEQGESVPLKNWYAGAYKSAEDAAAKTLGEYRALAQKTMVFRDALYSCTLPKSALEAAGASISILVTPVCRRLEDGSFWAWEGASELGGSCEGTCQHVWNYAYALPYLFPRLEMSVRRLERDYSQRADGRVSFRLRLPPGRGEGWKMPCVDGQMGYILKIFREWRLSGDDNWLDEMWPSAKKALEFAWLDSDVKWDADRDGIITGRQHHTLDMELFGANPWLEGFYLAALKAMAVMADYRGEDSAEYARLFENGARYLNEELFNGEYYFQKVNLRDKSQLDAYENAEGYWNSEAGELKYQIGQGLIIDQALAQWHANLLGLGDIYDKDKLRTALKALMRHNFKPSMRDFCNPCRVFSLGGEAGLVMCEYPEGAEKPAIPVPYCQETMTGFEYAAAGLMAQTGMTREAETVISAVRDRYDGKKRNPWNEIECGSNYARTMAAFAFLPIYGGVKCDAVTGSMEIMPLNDGDSRTIWFMGGAWGEIAITGKTAIINVLGGALTLKNLKLPFTPGQISIDGRKAGFRIAGGRAEFNTKETASNIIRVQ